MISGDIESLLHTKEETLHVDFAERFHTVILQTTRFPSTISIDGVWGTGKTSIMRILHEKLAHTGYPVFWFNPWKYRQSSSVVLAFFQSLYLTAADTRFLTEMNTQGATILRVLLESGMDAGLKIIAKGRFSWKDLIYAFTPFDDAESFRVDDYDKTLSTIAQEFSGLIRAISRHHQHKPVIIFVDDLDRCCPVDMMRFLEALRTLFIIRGCRVIFVCGVDHQVVKHFICNHYRGLGEQFAEHYVRKIFQVTFSDRRQKRNWVAK